MPRPRFPLLHAAAAAACTFCLCAPGLAQPSPVGAPGPTRAEAAAQKAGIPGPAVPPLYIIAPTEVRADPTLAKGCWVRLFPEPNYEGTDDLTVAGPASLPSLHTPAGNVYWKQKAESVIVGPKAKVSIFESRSYHDKSATLEPGTRTPQLRKSLKLAKSIDSLKIDCVP